MFPPTVSARKKPGKDELLAELSLRKRQRRLFDYRPYPKQFAFHEAGASYRERLFMAGNQEGKSYSAAHEVAIHATGFYPQWWTGRKYRDLSTIWTGATTNEKSKGIIQKSLLGTTSASLKHPDMGTGTIPKNAILKVTTRQAGVKDVADEIIVRHVSGKTVRIALLTYEMGSAKWAGEPVDLVWLDEEPADYDIYSEAFTRTNATKGSMMLTFTPMLGLSKTVMRYLEPDPGSPPRSVTNMDIYDCIGGVWPEDTPFAGRKWQGHYTKEEADNIVASYEPWERKARAFGTPILGEGLVYAVDESEILVSPFEIPDHYACIIGCDFGIGHPGSGVLLAHDRNTDTVYVVKCYKKKDELPLYHAASLKGLGDFPIAWPHDGHKRGPGSGVELHKEYREHGANMLPISARYDNEKGSRQDPEIIIGRILERMRTGRFKVFSNQEEWLKEFRLYHRKDGVLVKRNDDILSATHYAMMMLRFAKPRTKRPSRRITRPAPLTNWA